MSAVSGETRLTRSDQAEEEASDRCPDLWGSKVRSWVLTWSDAAILARRVSHFHRFLTALARLAFRSVRSKDLEIIVLRHQLQVLQRQVERPSICDDDRTLLAANAAARPAASARAGS